MALTMTLMVKSTSKNTQHGYNRHEQPQPLTVTPHRCAFYYDKMKHMIVDGVFYVNDAYSQGKRIITEGKPISSPAFACVYSLSLYTTVTQVPMPACWTLTLAPTPSSPPPLPPLEASPLDLACTPSHHDTSVTLGQASPHTSQPRSPDKIDCAMGVVKAYTTRVGAGPFPTGTHTLSLEPQTTTLSPHTALTHLCDRAD